MLKIITKAWLCVWWATFKMMKLAASVLLQLSICLHRDRINGVTQIIASLVIRDKSNWVWSVCGRCCVQIGGRREAEDSDLKQKLGLCAGAAGGMPTRDRPNWEYSIQTGNAICETYNNHILNAGASIQSDLNTIVRLTKTGVTISNV